MDEEEIDVGNSTTNDSYEYYDYDLYYEQHVIPYLKKHIFPKSYEWFLITTYFLIFVFAMVGNILVCLVVVKNKHMRSVTNIYIVNLSIADILVMIVCLPPTVLVDVTASWFFGPIACKFIPYFQIVSISVSIFTLGAIAVDRYFAICQPLSFTSTSKRALSITFCIWLLALSIPIPIAIFNGYEDAFVRIDIPYLSICSELYWHNTTQQKVYHVVLFVAIYLAPLILITTAYSRICAKLWSAIPGEYDQEKRSQNSSMNKSSESRKKVAKMLIIVVILYALCFLPLHVFNLLRVFQHFENAFSDEKTMSEVNAVRDSTHVAFLVSHWLAFANSSINPIVYNFLSAKFRKEYKVVFAACICFSKSHKKRKGTARERGSVNSSNMLSRTVNTTAVDTAMSMHQLQDQKPLKNSV